MKKKLISLSLVAAMLMTSLSTAGMSVFADGTESTTDTSSTTVVTSTEATTTTTTKSKLDIIGDAIKDKVKEEIKEQGQAMVSKVVDKMTSTTTTTTTTVATTTTTTASTDTSDTTASSAVEGSTSASTEESTTAVAVTKPTAVSASDLKPAKINCKAVAKAIIKKIFSKKFNPITVNKKEITIRRGHYSYIKAKAQGHITYISSNPSVVTVDKDGIVKGVAQGNAKVRIIAWGNAEYHPSTTSVSVNVQPSILDIFAPIFK